MPGDICDAISRNSNNLLVLVNFSNMKNRFKYFTSVFLLPMLFAACNQKGVTNNKTQTLTQVDKLFADFAEKKTDKAEKLKALDIIGDKLKNISADTISVPDYLKLAHLYNELQDTKRQRTTLQHLLKVSEAQQNYPGAGYAAYYISDAYYSSTSYDSAYFYLSKAERASHLGKLSQLSGYIVLNKANILSFKKDFVGAEDKAIHALRIASVNNDTRLEYECYLSLGNALSGLNDNDKALFYYNRAFEKTPSLTADGQYLILKAQVYNSIAKIYQKRGNHSRAIVYLKKALAFGDLYKADVKVYSYLQNNLAYSKFKLKDPSALGHFKEVLRISDSIQNLPTIVSVKINLAEYYLSVNDKPTALSYISDARKKAHDNHIFEDELKTLAFLSEIDPANGVRYNKNYINLSDSLQNVERATRNKFARIEFETDEIVHQKNAAIAENKAISTQRWLILGVSIMAVLLVLALYYIKSAKAKNKELLLVKEQQKSNEQIYELMLDQQQKIEEGKQLEKKRMSQELHDGIMGRLTSIRLNLFILSKKTDPETIDKCLGHIKEIQNIEKEIRTIAHDLNKNLFSDSINFVAIVRNLFTSIENHSGINFNMEVDERIDWQIIHSNVKMQIYRILQESLQNIDKYAKASKVYINMAFDTNIITITVLDDGEGFDTNKVRTGIGIQNMHERAKEINGKIDIASEVGVGTKINLTIPI